MDWQNVQELWKLQFLHEFNSLLSSFKGHHFQNILICKDGWVAIKLQINNRGRELPYRSLLRGHSRACLCPHPRAREVSVLQPAHTGAGEPGGDTCSEKTQKGGKKKTGDGTWALQSAVVYGLNQVRAKWYLLRTAILKEDDEVQLKSNGEKMLKKK